MTTDTDVVVQYYDWSGRYAVDKNTVTFRGGCPNEESIVTIGDNVYFVSDVKTKDDKGFPMIPTIRVLAIHAVH